MSSVARQRGWGIAPPAGRSGTGPYEKPNPFRSRRPSEPHLSPTTTKARFQPGEETPKGYRKLSGSGDRTGTSQLSHPRLCVDCPRRLIGGPRKMGVQGGASISDGAKPHSICGSPLAVLWLLSARAESNPPRRAEPCKTARRGQAPALHYAKTGGHSPLQAGSSVIPKR